MTNNDKALAALDNIVTAYCMSIGLKPPIPDPESQTAEQVELIKAALTPQSSADLGRVREYIEQSVLDLSYYIHLATKAKTNNKWIDCEVYKITMSLERLEKSIAILDQQPAPVNTLDLDALSWEQIKEAVDHSPWIPEDYQQNDIVSDICEFLKDRDAPLSALRAKIEGMKRDTRTIHGFVDVLREDIAHNAAITAVLSEIDNMMKAGE